MPGYTPIALDPGDGSYSFYRREATGEIYSAAEIREIEEMLHFGALFSMRFVGGGNALGECSALQIW